MIIFLLSLIQILVLMAGVPVLKWQELWRDAVNRHGGDVTVVHLPEVGIKRQYAFPFF